MSNNQQVIIGSTAQYVEASSHLPVTARNIAGETLYYKTASTVSSSDTALTAGSSVAMTGGLWFISAQTAGGTGLLAVYPTAGSEVDSEAILGNATVGGTLAVTGATTLTGAITATGAISANNGLTVADAKDVTIASTTGSKIGQSGSKIGFYGATPIVKAGAYTQTYSTAARTVPAATAVAVATTAATLTAPYGYAGAAQADAIPVAINAVQADVLALAKVVNALIDDLQAYGLAA